MISIRRRLTRDLLSAVLLLLGGGLTALYFAARDAATDEFDTALEAKAHAISTLTILENGRVRVTFNDRFMPGFEERKPRDFFQLWDAKGGEVARSESLEHDGQLPHRTGSLQRPAQWNLTLPNGRPGRAIGFSFRPKGAPARGSGEDTDLRLVVASDREHLDETLWQLLGLCAGLGVLLVAVTLWVIPRVLRRGLQPLDRLGEEAAQIEAATLATRFAVEPLPSELRPIAQRLNDLFARLEHSFERERRFSADLAHELRTPLAELRTMAECALKWPDARDPATDRETLNIARQMERVVVHILALARSEQGQIALQSEPLALAPFLQTTWAPFVARAAARHLDVALELSAAEGAADPALLRSILVNLFENAVDYTPPEGEIKIGLARLAGEVVITVANTASDLRPEDLPKLFDRFWRKESARSDGLHVGLGLSLSQAFARAMRWSLRASFDDRQRLLFTLSGPETQPASIARRCEPEAAPLA